MRGTLGGRNTRVTPPVCRHRHDGRAVHVTITGPPRRARDGVTWSYQVPPVEVVRLTVPSAARVSV